MVQSLKEATIWFDFHYLANHLVFLSITLYSGAVVICLCHVYSSFVSTFNTKGSNFTDVEEMETRCTIYLMKHGSELKAVKPVLRCLMQGARWYHVSKWGRQTVGLITHSWSLKMIKDELKIILTRYQKLALKAHRKKYTAEVPGVKYDKGRRVLKLSLGPMPTKS